MVEGGPKKQESKDAVSGEQQSEVYDLGVIQPIQMIRTAQVSSTGTFTVVRRVDVLCR